MNIRSFMHKARESKFYLNLLNMGLNRVVPFNKPHGFAILELGYDSIKTLLPYKRKNLNHIKGLHACALATLSEFSTGALLLSIIDPDKYRIILKQIKVDYHYQGKMDAIGEFQISKDWLDENIWQPLENAESVDIDCSIRIHDKQHNHLCTGHVTWQIKDWAKVQTKS